MKASKMSVNGVSVCAMGEEKYEIFVAGAFRGTEYCHYEYRHTDGELFSIIRPSLEVCRQKRNEWLKHHIISTSSLQEIRQNGKTIRHSTDGVSIGMIFNNLTGVNSLTGEEYRTYIQCVAIPHMGFEYGKIKLVADSITLATGTIRETL